MAERTAVLNVVGLTPRLLGADMPRLRRAAEAGGRRRVRPVLPAVTCTAQSTYLTGQPPAGHGAVANGWYDRDLAEHHFWKQSNRLVRGPKLWETLRTRRPGFTCAKLFWWYNLYASADWSLTPRPLYPADGRKIFDVMSHPLGIRDAIKRDLGEFPFPAFWGPAAGIASSEWIARSAEWIEERHRPDLALVYLPHLDYNLQRLGPDDPRIAQDARAIDGVAGGLLDFYAARGVRTLVVSEYGITAVRRAIALNRVFRARGWLTIKDELGRELLELGSSRVFAIADHQVAHIYVNDPALLGAARAAVEAVEGVAGVLDAAGKTRRGPGPPALGRSGGVRGGGRVVLVLLLGGRRARAGFRAGRGDPPQVRLRPGGAVPRSGARGWPRLRIGATLLRRKLGFRALMNVIPLDASLVKGSHGTCPANPDEWPVLIGAGGHPDDAPIAATAVYDHLLAACGG
jgi:hypothetical protein